MKVYEVLDDASLIKDDIKTNKGKAMAAIIKGAKKKSNGVPLPNNDIDPDEVRDRG